MSDLTQDHPIGRDNSTADDTAKLAMFPLSNGGVRFIIMEHPSNKQLAFVDLSARRVRDLIDRDLPKLLAQG